MANGHRQIVCVSVSFKRLVVKLAGFLALWNILLLNFKGEKKFNFTDGEKIQKSSIKSRKPQTQKSEEGEQEGSHEKFRIINSALMALKCQRAAMWSINEMRFTWARDRISQYNSYQLLSQNYWQNMRIIFEIKLLGVVYELRHVKNNFEPFSIYTINCAFYQKI